MPSLHDLQRAFGTALLFGDGAAIEPYIFANGIAPAARLRIYRNNTREGFLTTLRATYPVLQRLVGEDYFRQMVLEYRERSPSPSGNLHHAGERLPEFLSRRYVETGYRYFADVARLEWAFQEVLVAADHPPLDVDSLQRVVPADFPGLVFTLHPAARLVSSGFPILTIWNANQPGADADQIIDLGSGAERVLLLRTDEDVELRRLDAAEFSFLTSIARGETLADAAEAASAGGAFDPGASLRRYVAARALVDFHSECSNGEPT